jgi:hypothetical protein
MPPSSRFFCNRRPAGGAIAMPREPTGASHSEAATEEGCGRRTLETDAIEFALLLLLILVFTPLSFGYLFAWLLYPLTVVVQRLVNGSGSRAVLAGFSGAAVILLALSIPLRVIAQTYGNALFATLLLFAGLAVELWRLKRAAVS